MNESFGVIMVIFTGVFGSLFVNLIDKFTNTSVIKK